MPWDCFSFLSKRLGRSIAIATKKRLFRLTSLDKVVCERFNLRPISLREKPDWSNPLCQDSCRLFLESCV